MVRRRPQTSTICTIRDCTGIAYGGNTLCGTHLHYAALQAEIDRVRTLVPVDLTRLKATYGPALEDLLVALTNLSFAADPLAGQPVVASSPSARQPDRWTGRSMLDEVGATATLRGASSSHYARSVLQPRFRRRLGELAASIEAALNPEPGKQRPPSPRCGRRECPAYDRRQPLDARYCSGCGSPLATPDAPDKEATP
jgi:hypothetical protein